MNNMGLGAIANGIIPPTPIPIFDYDDPKRDIDADISPLDSVAGGVTPDQARGWQRLSTTASAIKSRILPRSGMSNWPYA